MKVIKSIFCTLLLLTTPLQSSIAQEGSISRIDSIVDLFASNGSFHGSVLVANAEGVIYERSEGFANYDWDIPNASNTKFRIGSITKQFTSVLIMQFVEQGSISLDDTIADNLPSYREDTGNQITIRHLLNHTSGLPYISDELDRKIEKEFFDLNDFVTLYASSDLDSPPGERYQYTNVEYYILGAILESISGLSYSQLLQERIFGPLGMEDSGIEVTIDILKNRANGYLKDGDGYRNQNYINMSQFSSAGGIYSTVSDLYKWDQALYTEELLSNEMKEIMYTHRNNADTGYANGWIRNRLETADGDSLLIIGHGGNLRGFGSTIQRDVANRGLVVILNNIKTGADIYTMATDILKIL